MLAAVVSEDRSRATRSRTFIQRLSSFPPAAGPPLFFSRNSSFPVTFFRDSELRVRTRYRPRVCYALLPFFIRTSHCPSNETTEGTGTKNRARNPPKYALYTGRFMYRGRFEREPRAAPIMGEYSISGDLVWVGRRHRRDPFIWQKR